MNAVFPLWGKNTFDIAHEMINNGLKAIISCVDTQQIPKEFLGRKFDQDLLKDLPSSVDPCGENGEFHTCVYDSPNFLSALNLKTGETKESGQFCFIDINFN
jgi:diphthamide synthase (EF-2-diphthine--ammonia ligase)